MLSWREPIVQLVALIAGLLVVSVLNVAWLSPVLAEIRGPLGLLLLVAIAYQFWLARQLEAAAVAAAQEDQPLIERERGGRGIS